MAENDILGNLTENLKDQLGDKLDPAKAFSENNLKKKRGAFWTCLIAAFLLVVLALAASVAWNATKVSILKAGVDRYVVSQGVVSQSDADAFVNDTLDYLTGVKTVWEPAVTIGDHRIGVPETFKTHMATVKGWVENAKAVLLAGAAIVLLLLGRALIGRKGSAKSPFSLGGYYLGAGIPLILIGGVGLWGVLDFNSLWACVHQTLIPDGIFGAGEDIMKLFPVQVFEGYLQPVAMMFGLCAAGILVLPLLLLPLSKLLTALFGKSSGAGSGNSRRSAGKSSTSAHKTTAARKTSATRKTTAKKTTRKTAD